MRTTLHRLLSLSVTSMSVLLLATNASALTNGLSMGINFGADEYPTSPNAGTLAPATVAGVLPQPNWNNANGISGTLPALVSDAKGIPITTAASVTWSCPNTWSSTGRGEENNQFPPGGDRTLMIGYLDSNDGAGVVTVTVSGLGPEFAAGSYDVIVYALGGTSANRYGAYSIGTVTQVLNSAANPTGFVQDPGVNVTDMGNYAVFKGVSGSSFTLVGNAVTDFGNGFRAPVSAIQLISHGPLPNFVNIGQNKIGTVTDEGGGSYTIVGGGNDIWSGRDEFAYAYTEVTGDFDVQVRVESLTANAQWSKAGIMVRESLSEFSRMAFARVTPNLPPGQNDRLFAYRTGLDNVAGANGGEHEDGSVPSGLPNGWLRLARIGSTVSMSNSADGIAWNLSASQNTTTWGGGALSNKLFLGLGVSRHSGGPTATAVFRQLQFNSNGAPFAVVAAESRGNPNGVRVIFNNPVGAGGLTAANYTLTTVSGPNVTVVTGLRFTTANDSANRDPMTFTLEGTTADPAVGAWTLIASGNTGLATDPGRYTVGPIVPIANANGYRAYRLLFPTVRDATTANSMQVAEIELLDALGFDVTAPGDTVVGVRAIAGSSTSEIAVVGTAADANNYPAGESPPNSIDNLGALTVPSTATKYLNFAEINTGVIVTPSGGAEPASPTVSAAAAGPNQTTVQLTTSQLVEGANYEVLVNGDVMAADGTGLVSALVNFVHGAGYEARRIRVSHNKNNDGGYYRLSDAVAKGIGDVTTMEPLAPVPFYPPVESNSLFEDPIPDLGTTVGPPAILNGNERFSSRISGVLVPTTTGNHTFYMSSDDQGYLYLSTDANPANKVQIASEPVWNGRREYIAGGNQGSRGVPPANISAPQNLQAGGKYYLEVIFTEGGGGNNGSAAWLPPGGAAVANGSSPIPEANFAPSRLFDGNTFNSLGPVQIVSQPATQTITALLPATFSVGSDGTPSYTYQWRRNGVPIPGATGRSYTLPAAQITDDQAVFSVIVANEFSSAVSGNATLTVLLPTPPHLLSAIGNTFTRVTVSFDNRLEVASAQNIANYTLTNPAGPVAIVSATRAANARDVVLITAPMPEDTLHTLIARDLRDETGTTTLESNPTNTTFLTLAFAPGYIQRELYTSTPAYDFNSVDRFITEQRAGTALLQATCLANLFEYNSSDSGLGTGIINNYGGRQFGYFIPTTSGDHVFYFAADDFARLFLSTDANPANNVRIAIEPVWSARRTWTGEASGGGRGTPPANISVPINLTAGTRYFIEGFFSEGGGGDNMAVAVQGPGDPVPAIGSAPIPGTLLGTYVQAGTLGITTQPQGQTRTENALATFTVAATSSSTECGGGTLGYQWRSNGVPIPAANASSLTIGPLSLLNSGAVYSVVVTSPGRSVTSSNALLSVVSDNVPPVLLSARVDGSLTRIYLNWSEFMALDPAQEETAYKVIASDMTEIVVTDATLVNGAGSTVVLTLATPMVENGVYSLEAGFQTDLIGNQTVKVGNPTGDPANGVVTSVRALIPVLFEAYNTGSGTAVVLLTGHADYPNSPDLVMRIASFDSRLVYPTDARENYGARMTSFFVPPVTGGYTFYLRSDDASQLWLSTDAFEANKVKIQEETGCCNAFAAHASVSISLVGGKPYWMQLLYKEGGGGDFGQAAVKLSSDPTDPNTLTPITGVYLGSLQDPTLTPAVLRIDRSGGGALTLSWGGSSRLQCTTSLTPPVVWKDVNTGGATTYTVNPSNEFNVNLDAAQAGGGARTGTGSGTISVAGNILTVDVTYSGLSSDRTVDHFHAPAARGASAGVVYDLGALTTGVRSGTITGNVTLVDGTYGGKSVAAQVQDIRDGLWYLNIHTTTFGGGEIRGQLDPPTRFYRLVNP